MTARSIVRHAGPPVGVALLALAVAAAILLASRVGSAGPPDAAVDPAMGLAVPAGPGTGALQSAGAATLAPGAGAAQDAFPGRSDGSAATLAPAPAAVRPSSSIANPVTDPAEAWDELRAARKVGWPAAVGAAILMIAIALGSLGRGVRWLAWLGRGVAATAIAAASVVSASCYDAAMAGGSWVAVGVAGALSLAAFWQARREPAPARQPERGTAAMTVLGSLAIGAAGTLCLWSCGQAHRTATAVKEAVVDCARQTADARAAEYADRVERAIRAGTAANGEVSFEPAKREIASILADAGLEIAGCAAATAVARLLYPGADTPRGIAAAPEPSSARLRDGWEAARVEMLGGRRFSVRIGAL